MFRIRRIFDDTLSVDRHAVAQVQEILRQQFHLLSNEEVDKLPSLLKEPVRHGFSTVLFVAEKADSLLGFATVLHFPDVGFAYLDFVSVKPRLTGGGVGGALYERVRDDARQASPLGLFFECLPDDPALCRDPATLEQNKARLRFYERFGARPLDGTAYETPLSENDDCPPYLVWDGLDRGRPLRQGPAKAVVRAILERKYKGTCPPDYVNAVVNSLRDDPIRLRRPRYGARPLAKTAIDHNLDRKILTVVNDRHEIHHVRERGYVEAPVRVGSILKALQDADLCFTARPRHYGDAYVRRVHAGPFVDYLKRMCAALPPGKSLYPYVFPIRNAARPPKEMPVRAGYFCIDTFTPLNSNAWQAARRAVDCGLTAAEAILKGQRLAYALVRPPGHHAERRTFGGFCYFNTASVAADLLARHGRVALLDIDYHHGNGSQDIFYARSDVLTVSIHGHPNFAYPYFSGFADEHGQDQGEGFNLNLPQKEHLDGEGYRTALRKAMQRIERHAPDFLVVSLGLDPAKGDPTGTWSLSARDFLENGKLLAGLRLPTLVIQEGGYRIRTLGTNARHFFTGLVAVR
ncbi:Histone deacetylase domain containing protein [Desulfovibrio sp. X2]|uniref:histone deacetylase family protein n=1 Tax=Desulfovibrio sp. X2 TaxID=941449 RepID=UPI0003588202|nr:histone deacetylase family protein [Desulfovibrio sp. X2]EPR43810.1 Histone deacetylase domain containing protein [Desulfovibrio sp. X2]